MTIYGPKGEVYTQGKNGQPQKVQMIPLRRANKLELRVEPAQGIIDFLLTDMAVFYRSANMEDWEKLAKGIVDCVETVRQWQAGNPVSVPSEETPSG